MRSHLFKQTEMVLISDRTKSQSSLSCQREGKCVSLRGRCNIEQHYAIKYCMKYKMLEEFIPNWGGHL